MKISPISSVKSLSYFNTLSFQKKNYGCNLDSFTLSQKDVDSKKKVSSLPIIKKVKSDKLSLQLDSSELEKAKQGKPSSRIVLNCRINNLSGFEGCETVVISSLIDKIQNFNKIVISAGTFIKNIENTLLCGLENGKGGIIEAGATLVTSNSKADKISSYSTGVIGSNIKVSDIHSSILNASGIESPDDIFIERAEITSKNNIKMPDIDLLDTAFFQTHNFKKEGQASIDNCTIKNLSCDSLNALNAKIGTITMNGNKTSVVSNSEINNCITADSDFVMTNTHIKNLIVKGKNKKIYISTDDNSKIDNYVFDDKSSFVIINNFPKGKSVYISSSPKK